MRLMTKRPQKTEAQIRAVIRAEQEARLKTGRRYRAAYDGHAGGPLTYGYREVDGVIEAHPQEVPIIRRVLDAVRARTPYRVIAAALNREEVPPPRGEHWTTASVQHIVLHAWLYVSGEQAWDGIVGETRWPVLYPLTPGDIPLPYPRYGPRPDPNKPEYHPWYPVAPPSRIADRLVVDPPPVHTVPEGQDDVQPGEECEP